MNPTVDEIAGHVTCLLRSVAGAERVERLNQLAARVVANRDKLRKWRARLRHRAAMQLYVNLSTAGKSANRGSVPLSVRVHGIECGTVTVGTGRVRAFQPKHRKLFGSCGFQKADGCEWADRAVAKYIEAAAVHVKGRPEANVESAFIRHMLRPDGEWRGEQQPVCLAGLPLQIPVPVSASGAEVKLGNGHIDVLARLGRGGKRLRVYELKAPKADASGALDQAVAYLVALKFVLDQEGASTDWWRLIGFSAPPTRRPKLEAFAFVADMKGNRTVMDAAKKRLDARNSDSIVLGVMYYHCAPGGRLEIKFP